MIITDGIHLTSTESKEELHAFVDGLHFRRHWFQEHPVHWHYDITTANALKRVLAAGAIKLTSFKFVEAYRQRNDKASVSPERGEDAQPG